MPGAHRVTAEQLSYGTVRQLSHTKKAGRHTPLAGTTADTSPARAENPGRSSRRANAWDNTPWSEMTAQQQVAAQTKGLLTAPNLISLGGFGLSMDGVLAMGLHDPMVGAVLFTIGSAGDLADGKWARRFGVSSAVGEQLDPVLDKVRIIGGLAVMLGTGSMPGWEFAAVAGPQIAIAGVSGWANKHEAMHVRRTGKLAAAAASVSVLSNMFAAGLESYTHSPLAQGTGHALRAVGKVASVAAAGLGLWTLKSYIDHGRAAQAAYAT